MTSFLDFKLEVDAEAALRKLRRGGDLAAPYVFAAMRRALFDYRRTFIRGAHKSNPVKFGGRKNGFNSPSKANAQGRNNNAFLVRTYPLNEKTLKASEIDVAFFTNSEIAAMLEFGGTARPRRGRWLSIPTGVALQPNGKVRRYWSSPAMLKKYSSHVETKFAQRKGSRTAMILVDVANRRGQSRRRKGSKTASGRRRTRSSRKLQPSRWRPAWILVKSATTPAKLGFYDGWSRLGPRLVQQKIVSEARKYLREVWGQ